MARECRYEHLYPDDVKRILEDAPICYVPLGAMEWHDLHSPLGTDSFIACGLCVRMAEETGGVVLPPHAWSIHGADDAEGPYVWEKASGTLCTHDATLWESEMRVQVQAIAAKGWRVIVLVAGHVGQPERDILEAIASEMTTPGETQGVYVYPYVHARGDHAGRFETNVMLGLNPELIRDVPSMGNPFTGQPKSASTVEDGREAVRQIVEGVVREVREALQRSWAAEPPGCPMVDERGAEIAWTAKWIGPAGEKPANSNFLTRASFELGEVPKSAVLRISAGGRYAVYINGEFAGNGPARGTHRRYFADSFDVAKLLKPGTNWIAAEVYSCLVRNYNMCPTAPALLAEIPGTVASDAAWEVTWDPSRRADALAYTMQIGFSEWRDMRKEPSGWTTGEDQGSAWQPPDVLGTPQDFDGRVTVARPIADLTRDVIFPVEVTAVGCVPDPGDALAGPDYAGLMAKETHSGPSEGTVENAVALTRPAGVTTIRPVEGNGGVYVIINFDREVLGNLGFDVEAPAGAVMDVAHDEALVEGRIATRRGRYRFADRFVLREGRQTVPQRLHNRGLRYVQLVFRNFRQPIRIHAVRIVNRIYSQEPAATFGSYDPYLVKLWKACVNTVRMCSSDTFMDCPWREQALWTNDQTVINLFYLAMTGDAEFAAHNLRVGADGALPNGWIPAVYPSDRETLFPNLPSLWTFALHDYYLYTGDRATAGELLPAMEKGLALYDTWRDADGLVPDQPDVWNFIEWGHREAGYGLGGGKTSPLNMVIAGAYKRAAALEEMMGNSSQAATYARKSREAVAAVNAVFWDEARGWYIDATEPEKLPTNSQHPLALGLYFDVLEEPQKSAAIGNLLSHELIWCEYYFQQFVLKALADNGRADDAMTVVRSLWAPVVKANSYTVWEARAGRRSMGNCGSLCHAFSCAPLYFLQAVVLGIRPIKPGFEEFTLTPQLTDLGSAWGSIPTPHGLIRMKAERKDDGSTTVDVDVPEGTQAVTKKGETFGAGQHRVDLP